MPEGHTLHHLARALRPLVGRTVAATSPQGRFADGARVVDGRPLCGVEAHGKHLLLDFGDVWVHVHLGLAGAMFPSTADGEPRSGVRLRLQAEGLSVAWDLVAPSRCELLDAGGRSDLLSRLGPDPLRGDDLSPATAAIRASGHPVGALLLDQRVVAGVGNVFRNEVLHLCRVDPGRAGSSLRDDEVDCIWRTLTRLMRRAADEGRIITVDTAPDVDRSSIAEEDGRHVYKQERCRTCGGPVRTWEVGKRSAYACAHCQA